MTRREILHQQAINCLNAVRCWMLLEETLGGPCSCNLCGSVREKGKDMKLTAELLVKNHGSNPLN
jgi:hypothetical protein